MSATLERKKVTAPSIVEMKQRGEKIAMLTAYDFLFGQILDAAGLDILLVGDSGAMVFSGYDTTLPITLDEIIYHTRAVRRGVKRALLVADMPFLSYQVSPEEALRNAGRLLKEAGAEAVKLEGGVAIAGTIRRIVNAGIPVMGHLGLTPQSVNALGGYSLQAVSDGAAKKLLDDAHHLHDAGVFAIVLEKIPAMLAREVTRALNIPTIGIGAGPDCDGQVLVTHDLLGLFEKFKLKFARRYAELGQAIREAVEQYARDVKTNQFPNLEESF
jgi:3-methyl-2-oxobutanoate hydroxymethyltransferase